MAADPAYSLKIDGLEKFLKALKAKPPMARVGILGTKKRNDGQDNAAIGAEHEMGSSRVPQRSFLRIPLMEHLKKELESANAFDIEVLKKVVDEKSLIGWTEKVAIVAQKVVLEAFDTQGFGKWQAWAPATVQSKKEKMARGEINTMQILVETQQLRNSIEWDVKESG